MKYLSKYLVIMLLPLLLASCYKDNSIVDTRVLSEIGIAFNEVKQPTLNMEKNEVLTIDPVISQTEKKDLGLKYEWDINYQPFSTEKKLVYPCTKLGTFLIRLKVSNADGSTFKSFKLNVNSPYEEGLMVLAEDESGEGTFAFMRKYTDAEIAAGKVESFVNNCFTLNNPGLKLGKYPTDVVKRSAYPSDVVKTSAQLYISSRGEHKIYILNDKTFELESEVVAPDLPDFKPLRINLPDNAGRECVILCEQGKLFKLAVLELLVSPNATYPTNVLEKTAYGFDLNNVYSYFWNNADSRMEQVNYSGVKNTSTKFQGRNMIQFFYASSSVSFANDRLYVITNTTSNPSLYRKTVYNNTTLATSLEEADLTGGISSTMNANSVLLHNPLYIKLLHASGDKIYSWFYSGTDSPTAPFITVDAGVVTGMAQTPDGKLLYVGIYDASAAGLKGSVYVYNMNTGDLIKKYKGVTDKPVKLFYKKKS